MDYNLYHATTANKILNVKGKRVLVIGCNTGGDCTYFVDLGAKEVHGVDVVDGIGRDFKHPRVTYHQESAEEMKSLQSGYFDLVYTFATMEHVPDVFLAFAEMERVLAPGGAIYSIASPLWNSRNGHHFPQYFGDYPWAHLRLSRDEAMKYLVDRKIEIAAANESAEVVVNYMYVDAFNFNKRSSRDYAAATSRLKGLSILADNLDREPEGAVPADIMRELEAKGYHDDDLRAVTHCFIAKKPKRWWQAFA
ncbi:SAM-dependent methyltransferase [Rhizobium pisi]|uniref:SAM-dependent methyltransferase n=2 Tax=Rhizobium TaxID=379 RepID=A0A7W6BH39_9HYPH|nr:MULTISPECIES: class I SAM-dependent methyltransferase [Rhizobium]MBB3133622.1 SAM-dependent methyltransferase [Rhizobium pisi]MBB3918914.1 SAM-dependent methyltransferase [Rhizobium fabae]RSB81632.1 class I SAM-dependent methyltransferase [Rhizobium pisi]RUM07706.1 class I SAM-dependent methyltransferase [Rhizobium fabae]TCA46711.1 class I SAM-dependent methyltransferase [Rhizobium pisi]